MMKRLCLTVFAALFCFDALAASHGIAMHGAPKYRAGFKHFDYVNPDAHVGGQLKLSAFGTFDTFTPYVLKGVAAAGVGMLYDTLTVDAADEPFSEYGLIAESIDMPADRSGVAFNLRKSAKFHDGEPITADDVVFTFNLLREKGLPVYRSYYAAVESVTAESPRRVSFKFKKGDNRELPLILGQMPVLPKHYWQNRDFTATTLKVPVGSGPYKIASFEAGKYIVYERVPDYWARNLPVRKGHFNFLTIRYDYYRDTSVAVEAFKAGAFDARYENEAKKWTSAYDDTPAFKDGRLIKKEFTHHLPTGMQGFVFNIRRPLFQDRRVRRALGLAFDFEWSNKALFYGLYKRTQSYFQNSELAAAGLPSKDELKLLNPYKSALPAEVFTQAFSLPKTAGNGDMRDNLRQAFALLEEAGWTVQDGVLKDESGRPFAFEILLDASSASAWERITLPYVRNLKKLGIDASVRAVDSTQYKNRTDSFDYDMIVNIWGQSLSPGNEQSYFWGSQSANARGSYNYIGVSDEAVDALIEKIIAAKDRKSLKTATRALDRVLLWNYYVVPHWYSPVQRFVLWDKFDIPATDLMQGAQMMTWSVNPQKEAALKSGGRARKEKKKSAPSLFDRLKERF